MNWEKPFYELSVVASRQQGLITSAQAERVGVDARTLDHFREVRLLGEIDSSVYLVSTGSVAPKVLYPYASWLSLLPRSFAWERPSAAHEGFVLSHESAARFFGLGSPASVGASFTVAEETDTAPPRATRFHVAPIAPHEAVVSDGVPVTTPHRTVVDIVCGATSRDKADGIMRTAVRRDLVDLWELYTDLVPLAERHHFPSAGPEFAEYFLPRLPASSLSPRNLRGYAMLLRPDSVRRVQEALSAAGGGDLAVLSRDERFSGRIAAEIAGRTELDG